MRDGATGAAGRQHKTSKLQNCLMTGCRSGEVIMRLRGANKTCSISHYYLVFRFLRVFRPIQSARRLLPLNFLKTLLEYKIIYVDWKLYRYFYTIISFCSRNFTLAVKVDILNNRKFLNTVIP
jgi:hypothetical protein